MTHAHLAQIITRCPRAFSAGAAFELPGPLAGAEAAVRDLIQSTATVSPYLAELTTKEAEWLAEAVSDPRQAVEAEIQAAYAAEGADLPQRLRAGKRRIALMSGLADLGGAWSLEDVTGTLTAFADATVTAALRAGLMVQMKRGKLPMLDDTDLDDLGGMVVLAMGKMGAAELNYSSDIDLICLFDETRFDPSDVHEVRSSFVRATRAMSQTLNEKTADGYVFRTDLRLRPDPAVTPVCMAMAAAENYYESLGRTWERAAYIKARACAGDAKAGGDFLETLRPFVWRRHLDFAAIQDAHDMRLAIREHKGLGGPITLPGHNMKLGRGGIREIEFFTQTRQLIAGGRDPSLRVRGTVEGLARLAAKGWVPPEVAQELTEHYRAHRTVEHRLQMVRDAQTHALPQSEEGFARIAAMMDRDEDDLRAEIHARLEAVHHLTEGFFAASRAAPEQAEDMPDLDPAVVDRWHGYPALRSSRGAEAFERLKPDILRRLGQASDPHEALMAFDQFLMGLPAGVQLFALLQANPSLADLLIDIITTSPKLGAHLSRNASVLDAVIGGDFFAPWPGEQRLTEMLSDSLARESDYEARLDGTRRWAREWHFRIGVHHLRHLISSAEAGQQYAELASAVVQSLWPVVCREFAVRYGPQPGRGAVLIGMGSLGAGQLTAESDLDLIVIYDAQGQEASEGRKSLPTRSYFARLTQALITAMTAPMSQGRLYELDMRLRPSGNQGPVATSWASFQSYQTTEAWVWEHLALTRARVIAGPVSLAEDIEAFRVDLLKDKGAHSAVWSELSVMRDRIAQAKTASSLLDAKIGAGRLQDIELFAQGCALHTGTALRSAHAGLEAGVRSRSLTEAEGAQLRAAYDLCWTLQSAARLLSAQPLQDDKLGQAATDFLLRCLGCDTRDAAETLLAQTYAETDAIISSRLQAEGAT